MELEIISDHGDRVNCVEVITAGNNSLLVNGYDKLFAQGDYGNMLYQHLEGLGWSIWYSSYQMNRKVTFKSFADIPSLELHFMFKNEFHCVLDGIGKIIMHQNQFNLTYVPHIECKTIFNPGNFQTFDVHVSISFLNNASLEYPQINELLNFIDKGVAARIDKVNHFASNQMMMVIQQILSCKYKPPIKKLYIEGKLMELFVLAMDRVTDRRPSKEIALKPYDVERIHAARDIILNELDNPITIVELAHRIAINDFKLKKGFKQEYGLTIFEYQQEMRMQKALELLKSDASLSITEIAFMVGYEGIHAFSFAFKKYFGVPPTSFRSK